MAVREKLARVGKAGLVAFAILAGGVLVAPGVAAAAAPAPATAVVAPSEIEPIFAPAPVRGRYWCDWYRWRDGTGMDWDCVLDPGVTITVAILCSDGNVYAERLTGPGRFQFYLTCGPYARVTDYRFG